MDNHWFEWLVGGYVTLLTWLGKRANDRIDDHDIRIRTMEADRVTRNDFDELRRSMVETYANGQQRTEALLREMHAENREMMTLTHKRVDALWERRSSSRAD